MSAALRSASRYDRASIRFHWATVILLILAFASIEMRVLFERGTPVRDATKEWHYVIGLAILLTTLARLYHRMARAQHPETVPPLPVWQDILARSMHWILYIVLIVLPVMGWLTVSALGDPMPLFFGIHMPALVAPNEAWGEWLEHTHSFLGDSLYVLIGGHAAAALIHHYIVRDSTLVQMMPGEAQTLQSVRAKN